MGGGFLGMSEVAQLVTMTGVILCGEGVWRTGATAFAYIVTVVHGNTNP